MGYIYTVKPCAKGAAAYAKGTKPKCAKVDCLTDMCPALVHTPVPKTK